MTQTAQKKTTVRKKADKYKDWTPQMQFSKRIARIIMVYWLIFISAVLVFLVLNQAIDGILALTGWVTAVMITMVGAYTGNSMYEKHLDKGIPKNFYGYLKMSEESSEDDTSASENG